LLSSFIGERSGNRGDCAQPCRLPFSDKKGGNRNDHILSLRDNCLASHIPKLAQMGIASLKVEGRMKNAEYVRSAVETYRHLLDENRIATPQEISALANIFSRGGFTDGYFTNKPENMLGTRDSNAERTFHAKTPLVQPPVQRKKAEFPPLIRPPLSNIPPYKPPRGPHKTKLLRTARFYMPESIPNSDYFDVIYLPLEHFTSGCRANGVLLPPIISDNQIDNIAQKLAAAKTAGAQHVLVGNPGHIELAKASGLTIHGDFRLNITNTQSAVHYAQFMDSVMLSPELNVAQMRDINARKSVVVYGRVPMMTLARKPNINRDNNGWGNLRDRTNKTFPLITEGGTDVMFNCHPTYMADKQDILQKAGLRNWHFIFSTETHNEVQRVIHAYQNATPPWTDIRRM
jgi:collagenase-like PrtC family protease